jgi:hypothetical protein
MLRPGLGTTACQHTTMAGREKIFRPREWEGMGEGLLLLPGQPCAPALRSSVMLGGAGGAKKEEGGSIDTIPPPPKQPLLTGLATSWTTPVPMPCAPPPTPIFTISHLLAPLGPHEKKQRVAESDTKKQSDTASQSKKRVTATEGQSDP